MATVPVIAVKTVVVHDDQLGIDRKVIVGQPVPPDLVEPYREKVGDAKVEEGTNPGAADVNTGTPAGRRSAK